MKGKPAALLLALALGFGCLAQVGPAAAGSDRSYLRTYGGSLSRPNSGSGIDIRAIHDREAARLQERWSVRARERASLNANRRPVYEHPPLPTNRLSNKLWRTYPPVGNITPRYDNNADVTRRAVTPSRDRIVPKGQLEFERTYLERNDR